jgi:chaperonin GroES
MSTPITPDDNYVVAKNLEPETKTTSGLYIPKDAAKKSNVVEVLAAGKAVKKCKSGDKIVYKSFSSTDVEWQGDSYILIKDEDVIATVHA